MELYGIKKFFADNLIFKLSFFAFCHFFFRYTPNSSNIYPDIGLSNEFLITFGQFYIDR